MLRLALGYVLIFSAPVLLLLVYRGLSEHWNWYLLVQIFAYVALAVGFWSSSRGGSRGLSHLVVVVVILVGVCGIAAWGPAPSRLIVLNFGCVFAAMFHSCKASMGTLAVSIGLVSLAAYLNPYVAILDGGDSVSDHTAGQWVVTLSSFAFYTVCSALLVAWVTKTLQNTITALRGREQELQNSNDILKEQAVKLEEQAVELEEQAKALKEERDRTEAASKAKDRFLSVISHELRTPLNPILGFLDLLEEDQALRSESKDQLELMRRSGEHLLLMIDKVVDFSELDRGELTLVRNERTWAELRRDIRSRLQLLAEEKNLEFHVHCEGAARDRLVLDNRRTLQIIDELGSNALKFTDKGSVAIALCLASGDGGRTHRLAIEVSDTGCGIDCKAIDRLFDPFVQEKSGWTRDAGGFGLGLSACQAIAGAMGGAIRVESEIGIGSTFTVEIPVELVLVGTTDPKRKSKLMQFTQPPEVLVVEDDLVNQKVVTALLKKLGAKTVCVDNGKKAVEILRPGAFDLVLMDISMPVMDGIEATEEIRKNDALKDLPIVALTAHSYSKSEKACFEAGMNGFLTKPAKADQLFEIISKLIGKKPESAEARLG
ncbi:response regulator receiver domain protein [Verrucomicrobiia bacterium DG1235]|nr:response regulator receiver domain protein [Verrucomicrobiae bacterium DG1235]